VNADAILLTDITRSPHIAGGEGRDRTRSPRSERTSPRLTIALHATTPAGTDSSGELPDRLRALRGRLERLPRMIAECHRLAADRPSRQNGTRPPLTMPRAPTRRSRGCTPARAALTTRPCARAHRTRPLPSKAGANRASGQTSAFPRQASQADDCHACSPLRSSSQSASAADNADLQGTRGVPSTAFRLPGAARVVPRRCSVCLIATATVLELPPMASSQTATSCLYAPGAMRRAGFGASHRRPWRERPS